MPESNSSFVFTPDPSFRLTASDRARLLPWYDADALERLLSMYPAAERSGILENFQMPEPGQQRGLLVQVGHPQLQAILDEVWVPFWETYTDEEIDAEPGNFPGRELAKRKRRNAGN
ncbi:MAG TPA: hypothetical protein VFX98_19115 [Longimicrobiaceae bacterium]|nr:hypothetical protein [Longimicrobiaceae bacterium]